MAARVGSSKRITVATAGRSKPLEAKSVAIKRRQPSVGTGMSGSAPASVALRHSSDLSGEEAAPGKIGDSFTRPATNARSIARRVSADNSPCSTATLAPQACRCAATARALSAVLQNTMVLPRVLARSSSSNAAARRKTQEEEEVKKKATASLRKSAPSPRRRMNSWRTCTHNVISPPFFNFLTGPLLPAARQHAPRWPLPPASLAAALAAFAAPPTHQ
jgi:hypothetical protein